MKIKSGFVIQKVGASYLAVATGERAKEFRALVRLNGTGAFLWELLSSGDRDDAALLAALLEDYDVTEEVAKRDIEAFKKTLAEAGILDV